MSRLMRSKAAPAAAANPASAVAEAYRGLRTNITFSFRGASFGTVMITSSTPGEGKSTVAANVAVSYAQSGRRTLIVDANLRTPVQHQLFGLSDRSGLSRALIGQGSLDEAIQETGIDHLSAVCAGPVPPNPSELLDLPSMTALLQEAKERFDIVIVDSSPITTVTDALIVASKCDAVVLVVQPGKVKRELAIKAKEALAYGNANMIGVVMNRR